MKITTKMKTYNLKQKQFNWLLKLVWGDGSSPFRVPKGIRDKAFELLHECGYVREYNETDRIQLLELREDYVKWVKNTESEDDLPF
jgi:hypothetical protein